MIDSAAGEFLELTRKISAERGTDAQLNHELHVLEQTLKG